MLTGRLVRKIHITDIPPKISKGLVHLGISTAAGKMDFLTRVILFISCITVSIANDLARGK